MCSELRQMRRYIARDMNSRVQYVFTSMPKFSYGSWVPDQTEDVKYLDERSAAMIGGQIDIQPGQYAVVDITVKILKFNATGTPAL